MAGVKIAERLDLYATLGLNRSSRDIEVKRAYKKLALSNHPDKDKGTETEFLYIGFAYHVLSNPKLRAQYDANEVEFTTSRKSLVDEFNSEKALEIFDAFFGTANPFAALSDDVNGLFNAEEKARQPTPPRLRRARHGRRRGLRAARRLHVAAATRRRAALRHADGGARLPGDLAASGRLTTPARFHDRAPPKQEDRRGP